MNVVPTPIVKDLVLIGGGHSHVEVLKRFGMKPLHGVQITLIARDIDTPYSGMLPGLVAGQYGFDDAHIDLGPLAQFANARLFHDEALQIDPINKLVMCKKRPPVPYDILSINIGSRPEIGTIPGASDYATPVKPINQFVAVWQALEARVLNHPGPHRIGVIGAGAAGVELILSAQFRLRHLLQLEGRSVEDLSFFLIGKSDRILPSFDPAVSARFERILGRRGVSVLADCTAMQVGPDRVQLSNGQDLELDEILWVTGASGAAWLADSGIALNEQGFIEVDETLRSVSHPEIYAAGDIANVVGFPREKAGVIAVRQGPPLASNLRRVLRGQKPKPFRPQRTMLALIGTGDKYAIASKGKWHAEGRWIWRWKEWIDRRWMKKYQDLPEMAVPASKSNHVVDDESELGIDSHAMRCGGCGAKVAASVLSNVLVDLAPIQRDEIIVGIEGADDAALVTVPSGKVMVHTVDYFRAIVNDPYVFGQIAANHALSDIFAMGAEPQTALAIVTIPYGAETKLETTIRDLLAGAVQVLNAANTTLVGGHTGEGAELALGFALNGLIDSQQVLLKAGMQVGDCLILTKPLGTGTLFAAEMRYKAKGRWIESAIDSMLLSNQGAAKCLREYHATACTDVTGFGLIGHLAEMIKGSTVDIELNLDNIPLLAGVEHTIKQHIFSSLQPANSRLSQVINNVDEYVQHANYPLLFDPQTSGGLLASVPSQHAKICLSALHAGGMADAMIIGEVRPQQGAKSEIKLYAK